jgi:hypothetical protein
MAAEKERFHWPSSHNSITPGLGGAGAALLGAGGEALWLSVGGWNSFAYAKIHIGCT